MNTFQELNSIPKYTPGIIFHLQLIQSKFFFFPSQINLFSLIILFKRSSYYQSTDSLGTSSASTSLSNPLDSNKTIHTTTNNSTQQISDEPSMKMAKLQPNVQQQQKKVDKKKALKRL